MRKHLITCTLFLLLGAVPASALTIHHEYSVVTTGAITWGAAQDHIASTLGADWHLATITSASEQSQVASLLSGMSGEYWLGGMQDGAAANALDGWSWVTGEEWSWTSWQPGEPNDWAGIAEDFLGMWSEYGWNWNDEHGSTNIAGYVAEHTYLTNPEPGTILLLGTGLVGLASGLRRRGFKR